MMQNRSVLAAFSVLAVLDTAIGLHTGFFGGGEIYTQFRHYYLNNFVFGNYAFWATVFGGVLWVLVHYLEWQLGQMHNKSE